MVSQLIVATGAAVIAFAVLVMVLKLIIFVWEFSIDYGTYTDFTKSNVFYRQKKGKYKDFLYWVNNVKPTSWQIDYMTGALIGTTSNGKTVKLHEHYFEFDGTYMKMNMFDYIKASRIIRDEAAILKSYYNQD